MKILVLIFGMAMVQALNQNYINLIFGRSRYDQVEPTNLERIKNSMAARYAKNGTILKHNWILCDISYI